MVKADVKRDYYADLELPPTADSEDIKRQFRLLAKQYHPDRNPGHEVEVVPKFQAVQAAHEVLIDPVEKQKYDQGRAKLAAKMGPPYAQTADPYSFARSNNHPKPTTAAPSFGFPPPKPKEKRTPFPPPNQKPASSGADKFNTWTRSAPNNTWDRSRFEAEAARGFSSMRQPQNSPQMPPRSTRQHPTAPKPPPPAETAHVPNVPPTSFPGLSRTQSARRTTGYMPGAHGNVDEPAAPRTSAYAHVRADRTYPPQSSNIHVSEPFNMRSPPVSRARPTVSPLRHARSSDQDMRSERINTSRPSAKYATPGGERTDIRDDGLHRSASVRNSPVEPHWEERGPFGQPSSRYEQVPRHRSASPKVSSTGIHADYSSSSGEDEAVHMNRRPKATPKSRPKAQTGPSFRAFADDDPALTGQFPSTNYTKIIDESQHHYPPPEPREHTRKPWTGLASPDVEIPKPEFGGRGENMDGPKYAAAPPNEFPQSWSQRLGLKESRRGQSFNGVPSWAVPSSVYPQRTPPRTEPRKNARRTVSDALHRSAQTPCSGAPPPLARIFTNPSSSHSEKSTHHAHVPFVASEWHDKVTSDDFLPNQSQLRKSPSKTSRPAKPITRGRGLSRSADRDGQSSSESSVGHGVPPIERRTRDVPHTTKAEAFQPGKLSGDWASNLKASSSRTEDRAASHHRNDDTSSASSREPYVVVEEDVMDVDDSPVTGNGLHRRATNGINHSLRDASRRSSKRQSMNGGVDLSEFSQHAPFTTNLGGLKDMDDMAANLPFESRPENKVDLDRNSSNNKTCRPLALPRPPKCVIPPAEDRLSMENFTQYTQNMGLYMQDWNKFNARMLEHFRRRQDMVCGDMLENWIRMRSDGPDAHGDDGEAGATARQGGYAGYATYMQWLQDDAKCREWWDHANELHMKCLEDLGRIREKAKKSLTH
ncbi:uncharacterized protein A1O9_02367 [Exophiala aquamarina CBS 119918]|uniref:J domain-containing protein n=1 Tax=Exophiala aquamarina CBS 119918 TaxID=1182545 RepID=A0A072PYY1_9EURO|nr:uncharacterized protein A1O9_02367 [Exophiala aquamarina CBS 119918]KEF60805.1 hypothetical protein A1O9_02367 [Exophiala aquamarina CBS 119918]